MLGEVTGVAVSARLHARWGDRGGHVAASTLGGRQSHMPTRLELPSSPLRTLLGAAIVTSANLAQSCRSPGLRALRCQLTSARTGDSIARRATGRIFRLPRCCSGGMDPRLGGDRLMCGLYGAGMEAKCLSGDGDNPAPDLLMAAPVLHRTVDISGSGAAHERRMTLAARGSR